MVTKHELVNDNAVFVGSAAEIVEQLRTQAYFERSLPFREYICQLANVVEQLTSAQIVKPLFEQSDMLDDNQLAEHFVQHLIANGMFKEA